MSRIEWNKAGERYFEAGVDRGVLYPRTGPGVPWNGITAVAEDSSGGDVETLYYDGVKYLEAEERKASMPSLFDLVTDEQVPA